MATQEIELNEALAAQGISAWETDLAELIVQLGDDLPSHILVPAIHRNRSEIRDIFRDRMARRRAARAGGPDRRPVGAGVGGPAAPAREVPVHPDGGVGCELRRRRVGHARGGGVGGQRPDVPDPARGARDRRRDREAGADLGRPRRVPAAAAAVLDRRADEPVHLDLVGGHARDGPQEVHVVLLDNGRTRALADEVGRQALRCIRCSACLNSCPVYERVGGHAYGSVYPGPIGAILNPLLKGVGTDPQVDSLPYASTLCGACADVCPVAIDIPGILVHLRTKVVDAHRDDTVPKAEALAMRAAAWGMADAGRMGLGERARRRRGSAPSRPGDAGWPPGAVLAALAGVALDPGPRPAPAAGASRSGRGGAGSAATRRSMSARDDVLAAVRAALAPGRERVAAERPRRCRHGIRRAAGRRAARPTAALDRAAMLDLFAERVADYRATVTRCAAADSRRPSARRSTASASVGRAARARPRGARRRRRRRAEPRRPRRGRGGRHGRRRRHRRDRHRRARPRPGPGPPGASPCCPTCTSASCARTRWCPTCPTPSPGSTRCARRPGSADPRPPATSS